LLGRRAAGRRADAVLLGIRGATAAWLLAC